MNLLNDTIAAISTPIGEGGLAIVRLSGPDSLRIADECFRPAAKNIIPSAVPSHTVHYGHIVRNGETVDEVMLTVLRKPKTFTREDMLEISCHGGILPAKMVLETVIEHGARLAQPGEFTKRAFLNGRIDLTQAEAVIDIIHSRTDLAMRLAQSQLAGRLSAQIEEIRKILMRVLAHIEAHIDFPDEDIEPDTRESLLMQIKRCIDFIDKLIQTADEGQVLRQGIKVAIIGKPNSGKSSLLNRLLDFERAIVSPIPGTTRDTIEETANIRGIPVVFTDTAGLRSSDDIIEAEGIKRTKRAIEQAELLLIVMDGSEPFREEYKENLDLVKGKKAIIVRNKIDLPIKLELPAEITFPVVDISCLTGEGIERLKDKIRDIVLSGKTGGETITVAINLRHKEVLIKARKSLETAVNALISNESLEFVALDLRIAVNSIGQITGQTATEDLLDVIFSQFCIGK
ncbi:MAG: tRNA uridine-5-carboxymethylaminomethyl(34) synthesis GTPase MnmE [Verrucomicrobiia bacterium]|jgi:tRNA modification GTPase